MAHTTGTLHSVPGQRGRAHPPDSHGSIAARYDIARDEVAALEAEAADDLYGLQHGRWRICPRTRVQVWEPTP